MGNSSSKGGRRKEPVSAADKAKDALSDIQQGIKKAADKLDDDHPVSQIVDSMCGGGGGYYEDPRRSYSGESDGDGTYDDETTFTDGSRTYTTDGSRRRNDEETIGSYTTEYTDEGSLRKPRGHSFDTEDESKMDDRNNPTRLAQPLASSFAKRCYFTKAGIGKTSQHYEGLTLTGNIVLMLSSAMKLKGCPTICDEDLRRVEQTYPNQFSRLPDELLLSSGWRRISKYCHFSNKPIADGVPFFHSVQRLHPAGGYYFLLAASVGMIRPIDVEPLTRDTLVLLETDFPNQCDNTPENLIQDPNQWTLVDKFCFFSGGPINTEEDVYYQADFDGNPIYMLAFLSPSLTPDELYKLNESDQPGLKSLKAVKEVEAVYDLTERDFDDLKLYHLGPCRALPQYILQPNAWSKVLPPHFMAARQEAITRAKEWQTEYGEDDEEEAEAQRQIEEEGAFPSPMAAASGESATSSDNKEAATSPAATTLDMDAPDPEDPVASPATMMDTPSQFQFDEKPHQQKESSSFDEEKKSPDGDNVNIENRSDSMKSGEEDFVPIKREGYKLKETSTLPISPTSSTVSHQSAAMREAQEILQKKRSLRRMEIAKRQQPPKSPEGNVKFPTSTESWESSAQDSSAFSDGSGEENKDSRRQLILQMAKARMKNSEEKKTPKIASANSWTENPTFASVGDKQTFSSDADQSIDMVGDLD